MPITTHDRESFEVEEGHLVRRVTPRRGQPYAHRCTKATYEQVAWAIDALGDERFTLQSLMKAEDLPSSQVATALAFLRERSIIDVRYRKHYATTASVHLDAMTEYHALAENG